MACNHSFLKKQLMVTSAFVAGFVGYGRQAYAACTPTGISTYLCSGANPGGISITGTTGAQITIDGSLFGATNAMGTGFEVIDRTGDVSFTDINNGFISGDIGMSFAPGSNYAAGTSNLTINMNSTIYGYTTGVLIEKDGYLSLTNNGNISTGAAGFTGAGIRVNSNTPSFEGINIVNTGTISGYYGVRIEDQFGYNQGGVTIDNSGTISATGYGNAIRIYGAGGGVTNIINSGDILAAGPTGTAIGLRSLGNQTTVELADGRVYGNIRDYTYTDGFSTVLVTGDVTSEGNFFISNFDVDSSGEFTLANGNGIGALNVDISGVFNLNGPYSTIVSDTLDVHGGGHFNINQDFRLRDRYYGGNATFTNSGTVALAAGSNFSVDKMGAGTGGRLEFEIAGTGVNDHGFLSITNGALDLTGQTVFVNVAAINTLLDNDVIHIAEGTLAIIGGPGATPTTIGDGSALWDFEMFDGTSQGGRYGVEDLFVRAMMVSGGVGFLSDNKNNENVGNLLVGLAGTTNPELAAIINNMNNAPTAQEFNDVLESVQPTVDSGSANASIGFAEKMNEITTFRLDDLRSMRSSTPTGASSYAESNVPQISEGIWAMRFGENAGNGFSMDTDEWAAVSGQYAKQGRRDGIDGYDMKSVGGAFGIDTASLYDDMTLGVSFGYSYSDIDSKNQNTTNTLVNSYFMSVYGEYDIDEDVFVNGAFSYAFNDNKTTRHNVGGIVGNTAKGEYDADQFGLQGAVGKNIAYDDYIFTPSLGFNYMNYSADSYTETGAGGGGLNVRTETLQKFEVGVDGKVARNFKDVVAANTELVGSLHAGYYYDFIGDNVQATAGFIGGGGSFTSEGPDSPKHRLNLGTSIELLDSRDVDYKLSYDYDRKEDYNAHTALVKAIFNF